MSRMLSKMNLISVVQQLPEEDIETIQGYVEMIEQEIQDLKEEKQEWIILLDMFKNQQKEFMEWLEKKLLFYKINNQGFTMNVIEEILLKYKEITGQQDGQQSGQV